MKKVIYLLLLILISGPVAAQQGKTELYDLIKRLLYDSTGYENVGDWAVGQPKKFPVKWKADKIEMSNDTSINFFRTGTVDLTIKGRSFRHEEQPVKWNIMLKGARMGYSSFSMISSPSPELQPKYTIDSIFGKEPYKATLLKSCDAKFAGYNYYEIKIPKKDPGYLKISWISVNGNTAIRLDCFDSWSKYAVKLDCPRK